MSQDTNVENLIINKLTKAQFESITTPDPTQLYFITDDNGISSLDDISISNLTNGQVLQYNSTTQKWENKDVTITVDSALDSTSTNPVENRVITQAIEDITLAKNPNLNLIGGNLNIDSGNVSGFSTTDYMQFPFVFNFNGYHWTLEMGFTTGSNVTIQQNILDSYYGIAFAIRNGKFVLAISSNGSSWDVANTEGTYSVQANTAYSVKIAWDGTNYTLSYALDETNYTTDITVASALVHHSTQEYVGGEPDLYGDSSQHPFTGTINLNNWELIVNGLEVWLGMDDVGLGSRANIDLSNLSSTGQAVIDAKVNKSGDTMTGALAFERAASIAIDYTRTDYTIGDSASSGSQISMGSIATYDLNGSNVSVIQTRALDNGSTSFQFALQKHDLSGYHSFGMNETTSGTAEFYFPKSYNVDGQWVTKSEVIASDVSFATGSSETKTYSLASYLPDDNYTYEVLFSLSGQTAATSGSSFAFILSTDIVSNVYMCRSIARTAAYVFAYGNAIVPLTTKQIKVTQANTTSSTPTMTSLRMCAYRRVGTNA